MRGVEVKLSHIGQVKYHYSKSTAKLTSTELKEIVNNFMRDIRRWIEGFEQKNYEVICEDFVTIYWWGTRATKKELTNFEVKTEKGKQYSFSVRLVCGKEIFELMPRRIQRHILKSEKLITWAESLLGTTLPRPLKQETDNTYATVKK